MPSVEVSKRNSVLFSQTLGSRQSLSLDGTLKSVLNEPLLPALYSLTLPSFAIYPQNSKKKKKASGWTSCKS